MGREILCATAAPRNEPRLACLCAMPYLVGCPTRESRLKQFGSAQEDVEEEGGTTSALDAESMLVQVKRWKPLGTHPRCPLLSGAIKGIMPCEGSTPGHVENFESPRISVLVSHCFERLLKRMPFPTEIGIAKSKTPCREATMLPRSRKLCSHPWRGWLGTMPR